jgi:hypothetical protein
MNGSKEIEIWISSPAGDDRRAALPTLGKARYEVSRVQFSILVKNLSDFLVDIQGVMQAPADSSSYSVDEIELNLGINASGGIALFGKLEAGAEAAIKVKLKRQNS